MTKYFFSFVIGALDLLVFLLINKRVHKEVFFEQKERISQQTEFKTIFNQLDEGIVILSNDHITQLNDSFKKFVQTYFGDSSMTQVCKCSTLVEQNALVKKNLNQKKMQKKCVTFWTYCLCWRRNKSTVKVMDESEKKAVLEAERQVLYSKILDVHLTSSQKAEVDKKTNENSALHASDPKISQGSLTNMLEQYNPGEKYSINDLMKYNAEALEKMCFKVLKPSAEGEEQEIAHYIQVKKKNYLKNDQLKTMV